MGFQVGQRNSASHNGTTGSSPGWCALRAAAAQSLHLMWRATCPAETHSYGIVNNTALCYALAEQS